MKHDPTAVLAGEYVARGDNEIGNQQALGDSLGERRLTGTERADDGDKGPLGEGGGDLDADLLHFVGIPGDDRSVHSART